MVNRLYRLIPGYEEMAQEVNIIRDRDIDYDLHKGLWREAVERLHPKRLQLQVSQILKETDSVYTLRLVAVDRALPPFQAGQYINLLVEIDGIRTGRPYSISSSPSQTGFYDVTVKRIPGGFVSNYLLDCIKTGDIIYSTGPAGHFYYNPLFHGKNLVFLAGGSGITPFMSMIRETALRGLDRQIHLIYGCRTPEDVIFHEELKSLAQYHSNIVYHLVISEPSAGYTGLTGFISADLLKQLNIPIENSMFYVCGPAAMYDYILPELQKIGVPRRRIRREVFGLGANVCQDPAWPNEGRSDDIFSICFSDGRQIPARASESLLVSMERAGIVMEQCCRSGECSLCRVKLISGRVFQPSGALVRKSDRETGYIHSCAAYPLSDLEILL